MLFKHSPLEVNKEKASVRLLLARNYFKWLRFDAARSEYTTVKNSYPDSEDAVEADEHTLLILDDVSTELRKNRQIEQRLNMLTRNRRHKNLSVICISHRIVDFSPGLRSNSSCIFLFKPKNRKEIDTVINELTLMKADDARQLFDFVYKERHTFLMIDCSLVYVSLFALF